jgi:hypothetical protein
MSSTSSSFDERPNDEASVDAVSHSTRLGVTGRLNLGLLLQGEGVATLFDTPLAFSTLGGGRQTPRGLSVLMDVVPLQARTRPRFLSVDLGFPRTTMGFLGVVFALTFWISANKQGGCGRIIRADGGVGVSLDFFLVVVLTLVVVVVCVGRPRCWTKG